VDRHELSVPLGGALRRGVSSNACRSLYEVLCYVYNDPYSEAS
jgi:hypothetical protein